MAYIYEKKTNELDFSNNFLNFLNHRSLIGQIAGDRSVVIDTRLGCGAVPVAVCRKCSVVRPGDGKPDGGRGVSVSVSRPSAWFD